jgi:hypothetical protein
MWYSKTLHLLSQSKVVIGCQKTIQCLLGNQGSNLATKIVYEAYVDCIMKCMLIIYELYTNCMLTIYWLYFDRFISNIKN